MKKLFIKTYGCQMNVYDSSRIQDLFLKTHRFCLTDKPEEADVILLNTCSIRAKAEEKVFSDLGRYYLLKKNNSKLIIGVGGCVAVQEKSAILKRAPFVDIIFSPSTIHRLAEFVEAAEKNSGSVVNIDCSAIEKFDCLPPPSADSPGAFVTIMEGCNHFCAYCIVPYTRGREICRPIKSILEEIQSLVQKGVCEITLLGQNVNAYNDSASGNDFADLIQRIAAIPAVKRIRYTTSHPCAFSDRLIEAYSRVDKLAGHLHLPVQSGSNRILKAMRRGYTAEEYIEKIQALKKARSSIAVSSDFIVGFPNESEEDFKKTLSLVQEIGFDHSFSFIYSPRPGTPAAKMADDVPLSVKKERLLRLQSLLKEKEDTVSRAMLGSLQNVLVEGRAKKGENVLMGRTENNRVINFCGDEKIIGRFVPVKVTKILSNSLCGEPVL